MMNFIIMFGNSFLPYVGMSIPVQMGYDQSEADHGNMTVLLPREERDTSIQTPPTPVSLRFDRDTCLDAQLGEEIADRFQKVFGDF